MSQLPKIVIVNIGMGNLYSVRKACGVVGLNAVITDSVGEVLEADGVILPGVGAFGKAMHRLEKSKMAAALKKVINRGVPFLGVCLGMQLLFSESNEFGINEGLNIVPGKVRRITDAGEWARNRLKVPHVGWNRIHSVSGNLISWEGTPLEGLAEGEFMYFVHSYFAAPENSRVILSLTEHSGLNFCSSLKFDNVFACQFHPEKSAQQGIRIYQKWRELHWGKVF